MRYIVQRVRTEDGERGTVIYAFEHEYDGPTAIDEPIAFLNGHPNRMPVTVERRYIDLPEITISDAEIAMLRGTYGPYVGPFPYMMLSLDGLTAVQAHSAIAGAQKDFRRFGL